MAMCQSQSFWTDYSAWRWQSNRLCFNILGKLQLIFSSLVWNRQSIFCSDTLDDIIEEAKTNGTYEEGILDIGNANDKIEVRSKDKFWIMEDTSLDLIKVHDYRGVEWEEVRDMRSKLNGQFYIAKSGKMPFMFYPKADKVSNYWLLYFLTLSSRLVCLYSTESVDCWKRHWYGLMAQSATSWDFAREGRGKNFETVEGVLQSD